MAEENGDDDEFVLSGTSIVELIHDQSDLLFKQVAKTHDIPPSDNEVTGRFLSQHLDRLRQMASSETMPDARMIHYTCSSVAVMSVLLMLSDMFS